MKKNNNNTRFKETKMFDMKSIEENQMNKQETKEKYTTNGRQGDKLYVKHFLSKL